MAQAASSTGMRSSVRMGGLGKSGAMGLGGSEALRINGLWRASPPPDWESRNRSRRPERPSTALQTNTAARSVADWRQPLWRVTWAW